MAVNSPLHRDSLPLLRRMGLRLRLLRRALGLTQTELAKRARLTPRRLSMCEQGDRHLNAGEIYHLALHLDVPVSYFFDDSPLHDEVDVLLDENPAFQREAEQLIRAFNSVRSPHVRRELQALVRSAAGVDLN